MQKQKLFKFGAGCLISVAIIIWLILKIQWQEVWAILSACNYWYLVPITLVIIVQFIFRSLRWRYLLPAEKPVKLRTLYDGIMLGNFGNYILPLRAGEFMRPLLVTRESGYSYSVCFVTVIMERFFDLSMVLASFGLLSFTVAEVPDVVLKGALILGVLALGLLLFMIGGIFFTGTLKSVISFFSRFLPSFCREKIEQFLHGFVDGAAVLRDWRQFLKVVCLTVLVWTVTYYQYYLTVQMFNIDAGFSFGIWIAVILALGVAAPSAPGFVGVFQAACILAFTLYGFNKELGASYAIISHIHQYILVIIFGIWVIMKYGLSFSKLSHDSMEQEPVS